jgi:hypothetical protein
MEKSGSKTTYEIGKMLLFVYKTKEMHFADYLFIKLIKQDNLPGLYFSAFLALADFFPIG